MTNQNPGDVIISSMTIDGTDFTDKLLTLVVTEYVFSPMVSAQATVIQTSGDQSVFTFSEKSSCTLTFSHPSGNKRTYQLAVNKITNPQATDNQRARKFTIEMVSKHAISAAATVNYQKSLKNKTISDYVKTILSEGLKMNLKMNIDPTRGLQGSDTQPIILTQMNPLAHVNNMANMAASTNDFDAFMVFSAIGASGSEEFNFKSLANMLKQSSGETITNKTKFEINSTLGSSTWNNIIDMQYPQQKSALETADSLNRGHSEYKTDGTGSIVSVPYGTSRRSSTPGTNQASDGSGYNPVNSKQGSSMMITDVARQDTYRQRMSPLASSLVSDMKSGGLIVRIPGNSNIKVGDIVQLELRENTDNFLNNDTRFYGKNIVTSVTSFIGPLIDNPRYVSILSLTNIQQYNGSIK